MDLNAFDFTITANKMLFLSHFSQEVIHLQFQGSKLDKKDFFGKSDPYLEFQRVNEDNRYV